MAVELPRCAVCRATVQAGEPLRFRADARVEHVECPVLLCPVCGGKIFPGDPIRRNGHAMLHGKCWLKHFRSVTRAA